MILRCPALAVIATLLSHARPVRADGEVWVWYDHRVRGFAPEGGQQLSRATVGVRVLARSDVTLDVGYMLRSRAASTSWEHDHIGLVRRGRDGSCSWTKAINGNARTRGQVVDHRARRLTKDRRFSQVLARVEASGGRIGTAS
jgi:hypothetical protein